MHNPNISAEGKHHAAQELRRLEKQQHHETQPVDFPDLKGKNIENVIRGYKVSPLIAKLTPLGGDS